MKECWREGDLRAYLDRELPGEDLERIASHLEQCEECRSSCERLTSRAALVADWMGSLDPAVPAPPVRRPVRWKWAAAAAAIAAGLLIGSWAMPKHVDAPAPVVAVAPAPAVAPEVSPAVVDAYPELPRQRPLRRARRVPAPSSETVERFVPLDADPIETGVIMRVTYGPENLQADIIFGPDGRARAYRLINAVQMR